MCEADDNAGVYGRPQEMLHDLPWNFRWEFTRRHPYYVTMWDLAKAHRQAPPSDVPGLRELRFWAFLMLGHIGVTGEPADPASTFQELNAGADLDPAFLSGAVQPMTNRNILLNLIHALPPAALTAVGAILTTAGSQEYAVPEESGGVAAQKANAQKSLIGIASSALDSYVDAPLYYVHMEASQSAIIDSMKRLDRMWKERRQIGETRLHKSKLGSYLQVWDAREGWTGSGYDTSRSQSLHQISQASGESVSTIANHHRAAFRWITGHDYRLDIWVRLFAPVLFGDPRSEIARVYQHRFHRLVGASRSVSTVAESTLISPETEEVRSSGVLEASSPVFDDRDFIDQCLDAQELMSQGLSDDEIASSLEIPCELIELIRERTSDSSVGDSE